MRASALILLAVLATGPATASAQAAAPASPVSVSIPTARPEDVASTDALIAALYDVISGPVGQRRDWDRFRSLFIPGGRLMAVGPRPDGSAAVRVMQVNDYIAASGEQLERIGFREREIARREERFGHIAHVFSTYEAFRQEETEPFLRGINSIQLMHDGARWWVVSVYWEGERPDNPLPQQYLP